jgi:hypothetical protein
LVCVLVLECARGLVVDVIAVLFDRLEGAGNAMEAVIGVA